MHQKVRDHHEAARAWSAGPEGPPGPGHSPVSVMPARAARRSPLGGPAHNRGRSRVGGDCRRRRRRPKAPPMGCCQRELCTASLCPLRACAAVSGGTDRRSSSGRLAARRGPGGLVAGATAETSRRGDHLPAGKSTGPGRPGWGCDGRDRRLCRHPHERDPPFSYDLLWKSGASARSPTSRAPTARSCWPWRRGCRCTPSW